MNKESVQRYFFIGFLLLVSVLIFLIFKPFLTVIAFAGILAIVLNPLYRKLAIYMGGRDGWAALLMVVLFILVIMLPAIFLAAHLFGEAGDLFNKISNPNEITSITQITNSLEAPIQRYYPYFQINAGDYIRLGSSYIVAHITDILSRIIHTLASIVFIFFSLFFFLRDGERFKKILVNLSPLQDRYDEKIFVRLKQAIVSTVRGVLLVSLIQGILAGIGMKIFGVANPTLWGAITAIAALVPALGTSLVFIPVIVYTYVFGDAASAIGLLAWWALLVATIDNFLGPFLYSQGTEIHQLVMLFAVLGGIAFFGPVGFIFGPVLVALFFALLDIYEDIILKHNEM